VCKEVACLKDIPIITCNHPTNEELASYKSRHSLQKLSKEKEQDIEMHLSWCTECQEIKQILERIDDKIDDVLINEYLDVSLTEQDEALASSIAHDVVLQRLFNENQHKSRKITCCDQGNK